MDQKIHGGGLLEIRALSPGMRELFRERDFTKVGYFQSVVEAEGIATIVRNKHLTMSGLSEIPIPEFFPALCVVDDDDYDRAMEIIRQRITDNEKGADLEIACPSCGEINPGNFEVCWSCGGDLIVSNDLSAQESKPE